MKGREMKLDHSLSLYDWWVIALFLLSVGCLFQGTNKRGRAYSSKGLVDSLHRSKFNEKEKPGASTGFFLSFFKLQIIAKTMAFVRITMTKSRFLLFIQLLLSCL
ncbi:hypothetical protein AB986_15865 [Alkalihalobacillus macyae]|uniref:Uncharacterized protein n=2 Tax=Guptibacillus hwajinpoensis TaxID=208199 RepID=A0A0J6CZ66_9BACL|nr:hypothetical protein AB986_15865 [Alkalihalobacillus macyae]